MDFGLIFVACCKGRCGFRTIIYSVLLTFYTLQYFALRVHVGWQNPLKNPPKTRSEPPKNRCQKRCFFPHPFLQVLASILGGSWAPKWEPKSLFWPQKTRRRALFYFLKLVVFKNGVLEGSGLDFGGSGPRFWSLRASIWEAPGLDFQASKPTCFGKNYFSRLW